MKPSKLLVSDLDGTLKRNPHPLSESNTQALRDLGERGLLRAVATGRSLYASRQGLLADTPIDYLIFSCGAGILDWKTGEVLLSHHLNPADVATVFKFLVDEDLNFMVHAEIPDNHFFTYFSSRASKSDVPDFDRRIDRNLAFAKAGNELDSFTAEKKTCQFLAIVPADRGTEVYHRVASQFPFLTVVRTTSPLDYESVWIEILPQAASKSSAAAWVAKRHGIARESVFALGNDYNDQDLLEWAGNGLLVAETAPGELKSKYRTIDAPVEEALRAAMADWHL